MALQTEGKLRNALIRALDYLDTLGNDQKKNLVVALLNSGDVVESRRLGMFDLQDEDTLVWRVIYHAIEITRDEERTDFLKNAIKDSNGLYTALSICRQPR